MITITSLLQDTKAKVNFRVRKNDHGLLEFVRIKTNRNQVRLSLLFPAVDLIPDGNGPYIIFTIQHLLQ